MNNKYSNIVFPLFVIGDNFLEDGFISGQGFEWFLEIKEHRLQVLFNYVFKTNKIEFSETHLQSLFYFLKENLFFRDKTKEELYDNIKIVPEHLKKIHKIEEYFVIEPSITIIFDISIYFGEFLIKEVENTHWHFLDIKDRVGNNRPIIMKKGSNVECNPLWLLRILSKQLIEREVNEDRLLNLFTVWKKALLK